MKTRNGPARQRGQGRRLERRLVTSPHDEQEERKHTRSSACLQWAARVARYVRAGNSSQQIGVYYSRALNFREQRAL